MKKILFATTILMLASAPSFAGGKGNSVGQGNNHGQDVSDHAHDNGGAGDAIGGKGNSDGDTTDGQAHETVGRGEQVQNHLSGKYGIGSN